MHFCVYIFEPEIYILLFNKLESYKVIIYYKNLQADFSDSDVDCFELQSHTWLSLSHQHLPLEEEPCQIFFEPWNTLKTLELD